MDFAGYSVSAAVGLGGLGDLLRLDVREAWGSFRGVGTGCCC